MLFVSGLAHQSHQSDSANLGTAGRCTLNRCGKGRVQNGLALNLYLTDSKVKPIPIVVLLKSGFFEILLPLVGLELSDLEYSMNGER